MGIIRIGDLPVEVRIGALPEERVSSQTVHLDLEMRTDMSAAASSDRLDDALNYLDVVNAVERAASGQSCHLVETLAHHVLDALVAFPSVTWARVRVRKFHLPGMSQVKFVEIEREKGRS